MIYMRLTIYVINKLDPDLECITQKSQDFPSDFESTAPHCYSIMLRYDQKEIVFYYHPALKVISVRHNLPTRDGALLEIFPNDDGCVSPNPATYYLLQSAVPIVSMGELLTGGHTGRAGVRITGWSLLLS